MENGIEPETTSLISGRRWAHATILLSLDVVLPFHSLMGLDVKPEVALRDSCREFIRRNRLQFYPVNLYQSGFNGAAVLKTVEEFLGPLAATAIRQWFETTYCEGTRDHLASLLWDEVLRFAGRDHARWEKLGLPSPIREAAFDRFRDRSDKDRYEALWDSINAEPLSDWDLHLYAIYLWDDKRPGAPDDPTALTYPIFSVGRRLAFWRWLLSQLSAREIEVLHTAAQEMAYSTENLQSVGELPHPSSIFKVDYGTGY